MLAEIKGLNEECGVFGIWGHENAAQVAYYGLHSLQHRGQEGAGIVVKNGEKFMSQRGRFNTEVFHRDEIEGLTEKQQLDMYDMQQLVEAGMKMFSHYYSIHIGWLLLITEI